MISQSDSLRGREPGVQWLCWRIFHRRRIVGNMYSRRHDLIACLIIAIAALVVFAGGLSLPPLDGFDDDIYVLNNQSRLVISTENIHFWLTSAYFKMYIPLTMFSYMIDSAIGGVDGFVYHLQNLLWHIVSACGLLALLRLLKVGPCIALITALIWTVHPQRVESVVWISERKDVLCAAWYIWGLVLYIHSRNRGKPRTVLTLIFFILALLSKPMAISFPLILVLYEWHLARKVDIGGWVRRLWPYILIAAVFVPITIAAQGDAVQAHVPVVRRVAVVVHNLFWYIQKMLVPAGLYPMHSRVTSDSASVLSVGIVAVLCVVCGDLYRRCCHSSGSLRNWLPLLLAYPVVLAPVAGFFPLGAIDYADRYSYLPSAALLCLLAVAASRCRCPRISEHPAFGSMMAVGCAVAGIVILILGTLSFVYIPTWSSIRQILVISAAHPHPNPMVVHKLGELNLTDGDLEAADAQANLLLADRVAYISDEQRQLVHAHAHYLKLCIAGRQSNTVAVLREFEECKVFLPQVIGGDARELAEFLVMIGNLYVSQKKYDAAASCAVSALKMVPSNAPARALLEMLKNRSQK